MKSQSHRYIMENRHFQGAVEKLLGHPNLRSCPFTLASRSPPKQYAACYNIMLYNAIYIYDTRIHICIMDICVNLKKSLNVPNNSISYHFPRSGSFSGQGRQAPQARPWQERDHGMRYGREALGAKVIACQYLPALSLRGQPKAWKQRKASAPRQQRLWNTFHSLYNIYVYIYIYVIYMFSYKYIYRFISQPHGGLQLQVQLPLRLFNNCLVWALPGGRICDSEKNINNHQSPKQHINNMT